MLLGVTGSVAAIKVPELVTKLLRFADVRIVTTPSAQHFFTQEQLPAECGPLLGGSLYDCNRPLRCVRTIMLVGPFTPCNLTMLQHALLLAARLLSCRNL